MSVKPLLQACLVLALLLASFASVQSARAWSACGGTYVVQKGDWLAKIARNCGVTLAQLRTANPWTSYYYYIFPGQVLVIPDGYVEPESGGPVGYCGPSWDAYGSYWVVCRGDTLGSIARYYGVSWRYLQQINGIWNANLIYPGQVIRI